MCHVACADNPQRQPPCAPSTRSTTSRPPSTPTPAHALCVTVWNARIRRSAPGQLPGRRASRRRAGQPSRHGRGATNARATRWAHCGPAAFGADKTHTDRIDPALTRDRRGSGRLSCRPLLDRAGFNAVRRGVYRHRFTVQNGDTQEAAIPVCPAKMSHSFLLLTCHWPALHVISVMIMLSSAGTLRLAGRGA